MLADRQTERGLVGIQMVADVDFDSEVLHANDYRLKGDQKIFDALTGQPLDPTMVRAAHRKELEYVELKKVWELTSVRDAMKMRGRRPISVRWVDVNKGDDENPNYRSRLVAREIRGPGTDSIFPPSSELLKSEFGNPSDETGTRLV